MKIVTVVRQSRIEKILLKSSIKNKLLIPLINRLETVMRRKKYVKLLKNGV